MREVKTHVSFFVPGLPVSKGSTRAYVTKQGKTIIRQSNADRQKPWASLISVMAQNICEIADCAISLELAFVFPRPKSHFHSVKGITTIRDSAPVFHSSRPDLDKLIRCVLDALTGVAWYDDAQIAEIRSTKKYGYQPGVNISINYLIGKEEKEEKENA